MLDRLGMGAKRVEDLRVWQLANQLRDKTHALIATANQPLDFRFRTQTEDAASSITRNIAEGFGRYYHKEFARFLLYARGSVFEMADCFKDGVSRGYWSKEAINEVGELCERTSAALTPFINHLRNTADI